MKGEVFCVSGGEVLKRFWRYFPHRSAFHPQTLKSHLEFSASCGRLHVVFCCVCCSVSALRLCWLSVWRSLQLQHSTTWWRITCRPTGPSTLRRPSAPLGSFSSSIYQEPRTIRAEKPNEPVGAAPQKEQPPEEAVWNTRQISLRTKRGDRAIILLLVSI